MTTDAPDTSGPRPTWDAFVSYSSKDAVAIGRMQRFIERYRLPDRRRLRVYRDETDIAGGELPEQLRAALASCRHLIVGCSPAGSASGWVAREIEAFRELAPGRPVIPVLIEGTPPDNLPVPIRASELRHCDLRAGWRFGRPRGATRVELVRVVAQVSGQEFRMLLPLDEQRRRRASWGSGLLALLVLLVAILFPVKGWKDVTPAGAAIFGCDTLDDGIVLYSMNPPPSVKNIVTVHRNALGSAARHDGRLEDIVPRSRLLPGGVSRALQARCGGSPDSWSGEPQSGLCIHVRKSSEEEVTFADAQGGGTAPATELAVGDRATTVDRIWADIDRRRWQEYGRSIVPSAGLPVSVAGGDIWLGFPRGDFTRGGLWHYAPEGSGEGWKAVRGLSDVQSVRHLRIGLLVAARQGNEFGFFLRNGEDFVPFAAPGKGDQMEACGEVDGEPVLRIDRKVYRRSLQPWPWAGN